LPLPRCIPKLHLFPLPFHYSLSSHLLIYGLSPWYDHLPAVPHWVGHHHMMLFSDGYRSLIPFTGTCLDVTATRCSHFLFTCITTILPIFPPSITHRYRSPISLPHFLHYVFYSFSPPTVHAMSVHTTRLPTALTLLPIAFIRYIYRYTCSTRHRPFHHSFRSTSLFILFPGDTVTYQYAVTLPLFHHRFAFTFTILFFGVRYHYLPV